MHRALSVLNNATSENYHKSMYNPLPKHICPMRKALPEIQKPFFEKYKFLLKKDDRPNRFS